MNSNLHREEIHICSSNDGFYHKLLNEKALFVISFLIIVFYFLPYIILGKNAPILILDNLDSVVGWVKLLLDSGTMFSPPATKIPQVFNGIPRSSVWGAFDYTLIGFKLFGIYWGYVFNKFLVSVFAFLGMYFVLKRHFLPKDVFILVPFGVAVTFALLPFWSFGMSAAGLPLALYAMLNFRNKDVHFTDWLILLLFPFCSSLVTSGFFFLSLITLLFLRDVLIKRDINYKFLLGIVVMTAGYIISNINLFYSFFYSSTYVSHRHEFQKVGETKLSAFHNMVNLFTHGQYHAHSLHQYIFMPILFGLYLTASSKKINKRFLYIFLFLLISSFFYGFITWGRITPLVNKQLSIFPLQLQRVHWQHPMCWYLLFAMSLFMISAAFRFGKQLAVLILAFQFVFVVMHHEVLVNRGLPTFRQFFAQEQFGKIKSFINAPVDSYRVISVGIHPSIAIYNGFYTLDGYFADYPLSYKHAFKKVIEKEVIKNHALVEEFDYEASRCYAYSAEIGLEFINPRPYLNPNEIEHLDYNYDALKAMGGKYIISDVKIDTLINNRLQFLHTFEKDNSYWVIYLYVVK